MSENDGRRFGKVRSRIFHTRFRAELQRQKSTFELRSVAVSELRSAVEDLQHSAKSVPDYEFEIAAIAAEMEAAIALVAKGLVAPPLLEDGQCSEPKNKENGETYRPSLLLDLFVPHGLAQDMHSNLAEIYPRWVRRHGASKAMWILRAQIGLLIGGSWWEKLLSTIERLLKVIRLSG